MQAEISLLIDQQPGSLFRVVTALRRFGLQFRDEDLDASVVEQGYSVNLSAHGAAVPTVELEDQLRGLRGVTDVTRVLARNNAHRLTVRRWRVDPDEQQRRHQSARRIDALIASYPAILPEVEAYYESIIDTADSAATLRNFGLRCGRRIAAREPRFAQADGLDEALDKVLVGFLFPIARFRIEGYRLRVSESIFTDAAENREPVGDTGGGAWLCVFLEGLLEGMLNHARNLPNVSVIESRCRGRGHRECQFHIEVQN